ncbi:MAG TPA: sigma-70 family RNA polymerase sigma factor, partial [Candidatus Obscuribacter sp.]|nr:sigma-70 family RNA polymerase sigma factor [Candidatus Obscuribacter sp.]
FATAHKTSPEEEAEMNLFITKLSWALSLIPLRYRQAFILRYQFDLTYEEISQVMNENENTVRTLLHRAKERLRKLILETKNPFPNLE